MLKIKDSVDLKKLKKFGFKRHKCFVNSFYYCATLTKREVDDDDEICIYPEDRIIYLCFGLGFNGQTNNNETDILFDLIQAGLVEKVGKC